jgi:predicted  nucleic acid-binding Zn-ribbon protein
MTIDEIFKRLQTLQDILSRKIVLEHDMQNIPKVLMAQEEVLARFKRTFIEKNQEHMTGKLLEVEYRNLLSEAERSREDAERKMELINTQREYEALDKEIHDAADREQQHRKELLQQERSLAELEEQIKQAQAMITQQENVLKELRPSIESEIADKRQHAKELAEQEQTLSLDLDPEVLFKFERIIRNKMGKGIVAIKGGVCTGCNMVLPAQFANSIRIGKEIVFCPYCSRILFFEEADQDGEDFFNNEDTGSLADLDDLDDEEFEEELDDEEEEKINIDYEE